MTSVIKIPFDEQSDGVDLALARACSGTHELLDLARVTAENGEHQTYDAVRNTVEAATASGGRGTSDTDRANSS